MFFRHRSERDASEQKTFPVAKKSPNAVCRNLSTMSSYGSALPSAARSILSSCRPAVRQSPMAPFLSTFYQQQLRGAKSNNPQAQGKGKKAAKAKPKKGAREFTQRDLKDMQQFSLCDAMRYGIIVDYRLRIVGGD